MPLKWVQVNSINIGSAIQKLRGGHRETHTEISLLLLVQNKESSLETDNSDVSK